MADAWPLRPWSWQDPPTRQAGAGRDRPLIRRNRPNDRQERRSVERQAINAPIQGNAADILRRAMTRMEGALAAEKLTVRLLLPAHDALVFEAPEDEVERARCSGTVMSC
nr:DNA polymerase [Methylobacterium segetis]